MSEKTALVTGIAGGLAQLVARGLTDRGYDVVGVDYRDVENAADSAARVYRASYNKTKIEDIFRRHRPEVVLHLGRVGNLKERLGKRFDLNVLGSRKVMDLSRRYGARRLIVFSTFHIYGAHPHNHIPIYEDEPLRAGTAFPQIADAIQFDNQAMMWIYRQPELRTVLLRPCNVIGPQINNAISQFLRRSVVPVLLGFDPMLQFIHQDDVVSALLALVQSDVVGVFNLAGEGSLPLRAALAAVGARQVPIPSSLAFTYLKLAGMVTRAFPPYLINFFKYPCIVSDEAIREALSWRPKVAQIEALRDTGAIDHHWDWLRVPGKRIKKWPDWGGKQRRPSRP